MISEGMSVADFISELNEFFRLTVGYEKTNLSSSRNPIEVINSNYNTVKNYHSDAINFSELSVGMRGIDFINAVNVMVGQSLIEDVIIIAGQSNAIANVTTSQQTIKGYNTPVSHGFIWHNNGSAIEPIDPGTNSSQGIDYNDAIGYFGSEVSLTKDLSSLVNRNIYVVKLAMGGTHLKATTGNDWSASSSGEYLDVLKGYINAANVYMTNKNKKMRIRGIFWNQGESDNIYAAEYYTNLVALFTNLRDFCSSINTSNGTGGKSIINIITRLSINSTMQTPEVRQAQADYIQNYGGILINTDALALQADNLHFTADSIINIGKETATQMAAIYN